jgi:hypothetical protein
MDRASLERFLTQTEGHVALGERHIARQQQIVSQLQRAGHEPDRGMAEALLSVLEESQELHVAHRDRLRRELAELPATGSKSDGEDSAQASAGPKPEAVSGVGRMAGATNAGYRS